MRLTFKRKAIAVLLTPAFALPATVLYAAGAQGEKEKTAVEKTAVATWDRDQASLYRDTWSAEEMIGTEVRGENDEEIGDVKDIIVGRDGMIGKVVVEVGGFLEIADQHIGVPWKDVRIGTDMQWVRVPLREVQKGTYALHGRIPQGEDVKAAPTSWRANELIGDYASLKDVPRYGIVTDVIFTDQGKARAVIVDRAAGRWGTYGSFAYPYPRGGYDPRAYDYPLPYSSTDLGTFQRFDYVLLAELSRFSSERSDRAERQQAQARRQTGAPAASGATQPTK